MEKDIVLLKRKETANNKLTLESFVKNARRGIVYRFNGKELDEETGLACYGAR